MSSESASRIVGIAANRVVPPNVDISPSLECLAHWCLLKYLLAAEFTTVLILEPSDEREDESLWGLIKGLASATRMDVEEGLGGRRLRFRGDGKRMTFDCGGIFKIETGEGMDRETLGRLLGFTNESIFVAVRDLNKISRNVLDGVAYNLSCNPIFQCVGGILPGATDPLEPYRAE
jgi:hypothetical protein